MIVYKFILQEEYEQIKENNFQSFPLQLKEFKITDNQSIAIQDCVKFSGNYCTNGYVIKFEVEEQIIEPYLLLEDFGDFVVKNYYCPSNLSLNLSEVEIIYTIVY